MYLVLNGQEKIRIEAESPEADLVWRGQWINNEIYRIYDVATNLDDTFLCDVGHRSSAANKPGEGVNWKNFWSYWQLSARAINGDELSLDYVPSGYTPDDTVPEASGNAKSLAAHLAGISNEFINTLSSQWKGEVSSYNDLPVTDNDVGDIRAVVTDVNYERSVFCCVHTT